MESVSLTKRIQWNRSTKSIESFNEINAIVEQSQWICFRKLAEKVYLFGRKTAKNWQFF